MPENDHPLGESGPTLRKQSVLVVDDEADIRDSLKELLETALDGVVIHTAESAVKALEILKSEPIDLIVSDYKMPGMNGLDFLAEARRMAPGVPRILITAFPDLDLALRAVNDARIENFFTKPLEPSRIVEILHGLLHERRAQELRNRAFARSLDMLRKQVQAPK